MKAFAEEEYRKALQRLIERDEPISLNKVALEAGKNVDVTGISKVHPLRSHSGAAQGGSAAVPDMVKG